MLCWVYPQCSLDGLSENIPTPENIYEREVEVGRQGRDGGHRGFLVMGEVLRVPVVAEMAGKEHVWVEPAKEGDHSQEDDLQPLGFEHEAMAEFVHPVDREVGLATVEKHEQEREPDVAFSLVVERQPEPCGQHREPSTGLEEAPDVGDRVHFFRSFFGQRRPVPFDRMWVRPLRGLHTHGAEQRQHQVPRPSAPSVSTAVVTVVRARGTASYRAVATPPGGTTRTSTCS